MKKIIFYLFTYSFISGSLFAQYSWTQKPNVPGPDRTYAAGFSIGKYGFVGCGSNSPSATFPYNDFYKWNSQTNTWSAIANYPGAGYALSPVSFSIEGYGYVGLGWKRPGGANDLWRYDTSTNVWTQMASLPGTGRYDESVFVIGHKAYVIGGSTGGPPYLQDVWMYDAHTNTWTQKNNSPAGKNDAGAAFAIGNHGYYGGGKDGSIGYNAFWEYDTTSDTWTSIAAFPIAQAPTGDSRAFVIGSKGYVCTGGIGDVSYPFDIPVGYAYDTNTHAWTAFTNMGANRLERGFSVAFSICNDGYIATGEDSLGNFLDTFWQWGESDTTLIGNDTVCSGTSTFLTATGGINYLWNTGATTSSISVSPLTTMTYYVNITLACGYCHKDTSIKVTVMPSPLITINTNKDTICAGNSAMLTVSGGGTYLWSTTATTSSINVSPISTTIYTVAVNKGACIKDTSVQVVVNPVPVPVISGNNIMCIGKSTLLTVTGGTSYLWEPALQTTDTITVNPVLFTTYTVIATNSFGCKGDTTFNVQIALPNGTINGPNLVCPGDTIKLVASGGGTYLWNTGSTSGSIYVRPLKDTTYSVVINNGCIDTVSKAISVDVAPQLVACCDTTIAEPGIPVMLDASGTLIYYWLPSIGVSCDSCPDPVVSPSITTTYTVIGVDKAGCRVEKFITVDVDNCSNIKIPNVFTPNGDGMNDEFVVETQSVSAYSISIYDRWGKVMYQSTNPDLYWNGKDQKDNSLVSDGVYYYIIKYTCNNKSYIKDGYLQVIR